MIGSCPELANPIRHVARCSRTCDVSCAAATSAFKTAGRKVSQSVPEDPFKQTPYRNLISWSTRLEREWPFLEWLLSKAPTASVIDLGCGTGEHARYLAARGVRAVGIDSSSAQIEQAREYEGEFGAMGPHFLEGDMLDLPSLTEESFGAALCLGNVLPYMEDEDLAARLRAVYRALSPDAKLLIQVLNYTRLREAEVRHLPLNFRPDPGNSNGELVWVRILRGGDPGHMLFYPVTLQLRPGAEPPIEIQSVREVRLRAWTFSELHQVLDACGFVDLQAFGDMQRAPFDAHTSHDLILVATRRA